jgi:hypothetical protein
MPNERMVKKLLRPLVDRRPDLAYARRMVFFTPVTHYLRGAIFVSGSYGQYFTVVNFVDQLFNGGWGALYNDAYGSLTQAYKHTFEASWTKDPEQASFDISDLVERDAPVEHIVTSEEYERWPHYMPSEGTTAWFAVYVLGACIRGDFDVATEWADKYLARTLSWNKRFYRENVIDATDEYLRLHDTNYTRLIYLSRLLKKDRGAIIPLLHEWEALKVQRLKIEKYWKSAPFPCEG